MLQSKVSVLTRKQEETQRDLYEAQMLAAQLEGELAEDETDGGDSLYRERCWEEFSKNKPLPFYCILRVWSFDKTCEV